MPAGIYWDKNMPGFGLRVSPKGRKTFFDQYRFRQADGTLKERQETIGTLGFLTVAEARNLARQLKAKAATVLILPARNGRPSPPPRMSARLPSSRSRNSWSATKGNMWRETTSLLVRSKSHRY